MHAATWAAPALAALFDREIPGWRIDNHYLRQANMLHIEHVMEAHAAAKELGLMTFASAYVASRVSCGRGYGDF